MTNSKAQVIAFANQKGGVAKTTTTLNLAAAFVEKGHRTLCVDLDPQGNLTMSQGIDPDQLEVSMYDVLVHGTSIREVIKRREVDVAPASIDLAGAEIAMSTMIGRERALEKAFKPILEDYDYIFIDTPPSLGLLTINALAASDRVIIPQQCEFLATRGLTLLLKTLEKVRARLNRNLRVEGILPTMFDGRTTHANEVLGELRTAFPGQVFDVVIKESVRVKESPAAGLSIFDYDAGHDVARAYERLAKEVDHA